MTSESFTSTDCTCVVGTLPPALTAILSQPSHNVVAYLAAAPPSVNAVSAPTSAMSSGAVGSVVAQGKGAMSYAIFEDTAARRRWTAQLSCQDDDSSSGGQAASCDDAGAWRVSRAALAELQLESATESSRGGSLPPADLSSMVRLAGAKYVLLQETWCESALADAASPSPLADFSQSHLVATTDAAKEATAPSPLHHVPQATSASKAESQLNKATGIDEVPPLPHPSPDLSVVRAGEVSESSSSSATTLVAHTRIVSEQTPLLESTASSASATSPLQGLSLHDLTNQHSALVRLLVQLLALKRMPVAQVVREVCTFSNKFHRPTCTVHDAASSDELHYTDTDVAVAVAQLTFPHPTHPRQRELKSEAYFLVRLDGYEEGALQRQAADRAYPALAQHWPASAALLDAMERYVNRDVVLETRKRHPELMTAPPGAEKRRRGRRQQKRGVKRQRSDSSSNSAAASEEEEDEDSNEESDSDGETALKRGAVKAKEAAPITSSTEQSPQQERQVGPGPQLRQPPSPHRQSFQSLREYPQSLERGDLRAWSASAEAAAVRACLHAATTLAPPPSAARGAAPPTTLTALPIATMEDVAVLRVHYDALATAETTLERHLLDYRDTMQSLHAWYRPEQCSQQFQSELSTWVQTQEESRADLVTLYTTVHEIRYRLERDLHDYLHLHALRVL